MLKLNEIDRKILAELMKNSKVSDRKIAKKIGVSQPTVTRRRTRLEREAIDTYTIIPKWKELGVKLMAIHFVKNREVQISDEKFKEAWEKSFKWMMQHPNVLTSVGSRGMGWHGFTLSVHRSYSDFEEFMSDHAIKLGKYVEDVQTVIVNLEGERILKPFDLKYLADYLITS